MSNSEYDAARSLVEGKYVEEFRRKHEALLLAKRNKLREHESTSTEGTDTESKGCVSEEALNFRRQT